MIWRLREEVLQPNKSVFGELNPLMFENWKI